MTEGEFEVQLRRMIREGRLAPHVDQEGMLLDLDHALEDRKGFSSVRVKRTGDAERMLRATAVCATGDALRQVREVILAEIRYAGETIVWAAQEKNQVRARFATEGFSLLVTGEIIVGEPLKG